MASSHNPHNPRNPKSNSGQETHVCKLRDQHSISDLQALQLVLGAGRNAGWQPCVSQAPVASLKRLPASAQFTTFHTARSIETRRPQWGACCQTAAPRVSTVRKTKAGHAKPGISSLPSLRYSGRAFLYCRQATAAATTKSSQSRAWTAASPLACQRWQQQNKQCVHGGTTAAATRMAAQAAVGRAWHAGQRACR